MDDEIWQEFSQKITPLKKTKKREVKKPEAKVSVRPVESFFENSFLLGENKDSPKLTENLMGFFGEKKARKFRKDKIVIDRKIDLHGKTLNEAMQFLEKTLKKSIIENHKIILLITGKGRENQGVLRTEIPQELAKSNLKIFIRAIIPAEKIHGGDGAFYVFLRNL